MKARARYLQARPFKRWYKQYQRESAYRVYLNEITEYVNTTTRPSGVWQVPLARILGVAQTSLGLGLLVEKITDDAGGIAPTVASLARQGRLDQALRARLDEFFEDLADAHVVLHDVSPSNIAYGRNADGKRAVPDRRFRLAAPDSAIRLEPAPEPPPRAAEVRRDAGLDGAPGARSRRPLRLKRRLPQCPDVSRRLAR